MSGTAERLLPQWLCNDLTRAPLLAHFIRRMQQTERLPKITWEVCKEIMEKQRLPPPKEQADAMIRLIGDAVSGPGELTNIDPASIQFIVGAKTIGGVGFVLESLVMKGLISGNILRPVQGIVSARVTLTMDGWERHDALTRGTPTGRMAFMAMKFDDEELDNLVEKHFRGAVAATGFSLTKLDDDPKAGSIDDRLRVVLQTCRFLIADLTHANNGAYWEAGYAEGLGKPVIYTCRDDKFSGIHFDTSHLMTVKWSPENTADAAERLKATIRATLPDARKTDD